MSTPTTKTAGTARMPRLRFSHTLSSGGTLTFSCPVVAQRLSDHAPIIVVPSRVQSIPFPPFGGKRVVTCRPDLAAKILA